jgi:putative ABC transport system substrate-binding protein
MKRRYFLMTLGVAFVAPLASGQRPAKTRRIAVLMGGIQDPTWVEALRDSLKQRGWIDQHNVVIEYRWAEGDASLMRGYATELVNGKPDIIVVRSATALREASRAAGEIPIVFVSVSDPVGNGFVQSLARPGRNITGFSNLDYEMAGKWLQLLREVAPHVKRVLVLQSPNNPNWPGWLHSIDSSAEAMSLTVVRGSVTDRAQVEPVISKFARAPNGGLLVLPDPFLAPQRDLIVSSAARYRLPAVYGGTGFDNGDGLIFYGVDSTEFPRYAALYVDRILKGESPANLPVQAPTKFKLIVNSNVAKALGLTVPASIGLRADKVVE